MTTIATLSTQLPTVRSGSLEVDAEIGIVYGVSVATIGAAAGWPFMLDDTTLDMLCELAQAQEPTGVKSRFGHPEILSDVDPYTGEKTERMADDVDSFIGRLHNFFRDGDRLRADLHIGKFADSLPGKNQTRSYILQVAQDDPEGLGLSAVFDYESEPTDGLDMPAARPVSLMAVDVVGSPAANDFGMLSARQASAFDPQPPTPGNQNGPQSAGWNDPDPRNFSATPTPPTNTIEFPMSHLLTNGPLSIEHTTARCMELCKAGLAMYCGGAFIATDRAKTINRSSLAAMAKRAGLAAVAARREATPGSPDLNESKQKTIRDAAAKSLMKNRLTKDDVSVKMPPTYGQNIVAPLDDVIDAQLAEGCNEAQLGMIGVAPIVAGIYRLYAEADASGYSEDDVDAAMGLMTLADLGALDEIEGSLSRNGFADIVQQDPQDADDQEDHDQGNDDEEDIDDDL